MRIPVLGMDFRGLTHPLALHAPPLTQPSKGLSNEAENHGAGRREHSPPDLGGERSLLELGEGHKKR